MKLHLRYPASCETDGTIPVEFPQSATGTLVSNLLVRLDTTAEFEGIVA